MKESRMNGNPRAKRGDFFVMRRPADRPLPARDLLPSFGSDRMPSSSRPPLLLVSLAVCALGLGALACVVVLVAQKASRNGATAFAHIRMPTFEERVAAAGMASRGAPLFEAQGCAGCHGKLLEGGAGPCLTDAQWIKGGRTEDILKSINEGSNEKGMPAFANVLSEDDKAALIAFIRSRAQGLRQITYRVYDGKGDWKQLPAFETLKPAAEGRIKDDETVSLKPLKRRENYGAVYSGILKVPAHGAYNFHLASDDGSALWLDGQKVVDNDGLHNAKTKQHGSVELKAGNHAFELRYFQGGADMALSLAWDGPQSTGYLTEAVVDPEQVVVTGRARIVRCDLNHSTGSPMLAIGLPGGINGAFDTQHGSLPMAWRGDFLDASGTRPPSDRGGRPNHPAANAVKEWTAQPLIQLADHPQELPLFTGYEIQGRQVVLHLTLGGAAFNATLDATPTGAGLRVRIAFADPVPGALLIWDASGKPRQVLAAEAGDQVILFPF